MGSLETELQSDESVAQTEFKP